MTTELEKNTSLESCAQEGMLPGYAVPAVGKRNGAALATGRFQALDLLMWGLCFAMGTLVGSQYLPLFLSLFKASP